MALIQPRTLKGFRDYLPETMIPRERCMEIARGVFRRFGYAPIDTPALEYLEVLTGKGGEESDRLMYRFEDHGGRMVGLRFDLTIPLARFAAQHINQLGTPFRRYHLGPVWRGENTHAGRYREFMQCDFDLIGTESSIADIETATVIHDLIHALGFEDFTIHLNNRQVLTGLLEQLGVDSAAVPILRALDKLAKIGPEKVAAEMCDAAGLSPSQADSVLQLADLKGSTDEVLARLPEISGGNETAAAGIVRLQEIVAGLRASGVPEERFMLDVSIARGLDYYTGVVFETFLDALPGIGSICSGGRYDNLAELYTKQHLPGVGASLGLDRLLAAMEQLDMLPRIATTAPAFIAYFDANRANDYLRMAATLRAAGIETELYPEPKKLGQQLKYADRRGFTVALIAGDQEFAAGTCQVKNLRGDEKLEVPWSPDAPDALIDAVRKLIA